MGDWPEFKLRGPDGEESTWTRRGDPTRYVEGLRAEVRYVIQRYEEGSFAAERGEPLEHPLVVAMLVEDSERRSAKFGAGPGGGRYRV